MHDREAFRQPVSVRPRFRCLVCRRFVVGSVHGTCPQCGWTPPRLAAPPPPRRLTPSHLIAVVVVGVLVVAVGLPLLTGCSSTRAQRVVPEPIEVEITAPRTPLGARAGNTIDDTLLDDLRHRPDVVAVRPRMALTVPALGRTVLGGQEVTFEIGGFADGIDPAVVLHEPAVRASFVDDDPGPAPGAACTAACPHPDAEYCDDVEHVCYPRVPALVSPAVIDLYDHDFAPAHHLPPLGDAAAVLARTPQAFDLTLGDSLVGAAAAGHPPPRHVGAVVVGVSRHARELGVSFRLADVERWNRDAGDRTHRYAGVTVTLRDGAAFTAFHAWIRGRGLEATLPGDTAAHHRDAPSP